MSSLCNNEEWLAAYLDKRLPDRERRFYEMHLSHCQSCLAELIAAKTELDEMALGAADGSMAAAAPATPPRESVAAGAREGPARRFWPAFSKRIFASETLTISFSYAVALALAAGFFLFMNSLAWDPEFIAGKSNLNKILAATEIGAMRLSRGPHVPVPQIPHFRGIERSRDTLFSQAVLKLQSAESNHPNDWRPSALLGDLYLADGQLELADACYAKALRLNTGDARLLNDRAVAAFRQGDFVMSGRRLEAALKADGVIAETLYNRAMLYRELGERDSMKQYIESYLRQDSSSPWASRARAFLAE
jgi:tetratricopeptide (TPR) repeat protein